VVCARAGALTFDGVVLAVGRTPRSDSRGASAIDRYLPVHAALAEHKRRMNTDVEHALMRELELPYPVVVGRQQTGEWSSSAPDRLILEGSVGVRVDESPADARRALAEAVAAAGDGVERGGRAASSPADRHPLVTRSPRWCATA
jgi:acetylornithine deacetylase